MGEIADGLINGEFDFHTGEYLGEGQGFPRTADKSLPWEKQEKNYVNGIKRFLRMFGLYNVRAPMDMYIDEKYPNKKKASLEEKCKVASDNWVEFKEWVNANFHFNPRKND